MKLLKSFLWRWFPTYCLLLKNFYTLAIQQGQKRSIQEKKAVNLEGEPIPWITYPALEYLGQFDFSQSTVFEFGAGNSSLYWARRVKKIISVESDLEWYDKIKNQIQNNQEIYLRENKESYVNSLLDRKTKYDIIIIDGKWRFDCVKIVAGYLKEGGMIIFDNTDWYPNATMLLREQGFQQVDFNGFGPINNYCWTTSIFFNRSNMGQYQIKNPEPIGGIKQFAEDDQ